MLSITEIEKAFPPYLRSFKRNMLREYLQYKILDLIFSNPLGQKLRFIGGTALRIVHDLGRFSEDLDFDHIGLSSEEFQDLSKKIKTGLENEGYEVDISFSGKTAFRCNIRIPRVLYEQGISPLEHEKILIQLDTESQGFDFIPEVVFINKFDVFRAILTTPLPILLSQKIITAFNRKRTKGRDFFDILFLLGKTRPDYGFLFQKKGISTSHALLTYITSECKKIRFSGLVSDLRPFVFFPTEAEKILQFQAYIASDPSVLDTVDEFLKSQSFIYDSGERLFFHRGKKTIMTAEWVQLHPTEVDGATFPINVDPKIYAIDVPNSKKKEWIQRYLSNQASSGRKKQVG